MRTIAVIALKGGSGKTTIATQLALAAHLRGRRTMVIDIDPQHSARDVLSAREAPGPDCVVSTGRQLLSAKLAAVGLRQDLVIVDTPAALVEDVGEAVALADYVVLVVRPTLLDISGLVRSYKTVMRLAKPCTVVVTQAQVARQGAEAPLVSRAMRALDYMKAPVCPVIVRSRAIYQTALERGRSAEESSDKAAAAEIAALWAFVESEVAGQEDDAEALAELLAEAAEAAAAVRPT